MLPPEHLLQRLRIPQLLVAPLETAVTANATSKREIFGPHRSALLEEGGDTLPQRRRKLGRREPELITLCRSLLILRNPIFRALDDLGQLTRSPIRLIPQHLIAIAHPVCSVAADVPVILGHLVFLPALRVRRAGRDDDVAVSLHRGGVGGVLLILVGRLQQPLTEQVVDSVGKVQFLLRRVQVGKRDLKDDDLRRMLLGELHDLLGEIILIRILRALAEVVAGILGHTMDGDEFLVRRRQAQIECPLAHLHLLVHALFLTLVAEVCQAVFVRCAVVRARVDEPGDRDGPGVFGVELLGGQVAHPAEWC